MEMQQPQTDPMAQLRNIKDFLILYNAITEHCFGKCVTNLKKPKLVESERTCVNGCAALYLQTNQRFMQQFMEHTPNMAKRRAEEMEKFTARQQQQQEATEQAAAPTSENTAGK